MPMKVCLQMNISIFFLKPINTFYYAGGVEKGSCHYILHIDWQSTTMNSGNRILNDTEIQLT